jgi:protein disulfide-isomerase A1
LDAFLKKDDVVLIGFYTEDSTEYKTLAELADLTRESAVTAVVTDPDIQGDRANSLRLIVGGQEITYEGDLDAADIQSWINVERFPLVGEIGPENYKDYMDRGLPLVWIALDPEDEPTKQRVVSALTPAAQSNKGKVSFVTIDAKKFQQHVQNLGITNVPGLLVINGNDKYRFDADEITEETVTQFFENYNAGQVAKFLKTQPPPEKNDEPVFVLVGSTFPDVVGQDKDVFVEFYAPWCGHCKRLAPEYEKVGQAFADVPDMVIAKIDATENDTPEDIRGFPTLVFYPKGESQGTKYQGERNAEAITEWLQKQATVDVSGLKTDL